jgi:enoyl-CoA hydratase/carnithine racemase
MTVRVDFREAVAVVTINDLDTANALTAETVDGLLGAFETVRAEQARCVVLTGSGRAFCSGGDLDTLKRWQEWEPPERKRYLETRPHEVGRALREGGLATVAAVNGAAYGAGMDLALSCDVRVATPSARFCQAYVNVGLVPGDGGAWLLPRVVGYGRALELLLTGRPVEAPETLDWGIVTHLVDPTELLDTALEIGDRLASRPAGAQQLTRELVFAGATQSWDEHLAAVSNLMAVVGGSSEHVAALASLRDDGS